MSEVFKVFTEYTDEVFELMDEIDPLIFEIHYGIPKMKERTKDKKNALALFILIDGKPVAFKTGFEENQKFHSWQGGVVPEHRGKGYASRLMEYQHKWAKEKGFKIVRTHTEDQFANMINLNQKHGFEVIERQKRNSGIDKIIMEKKL